MRRWWIALVVACLVAPGLAPAQERGPWWGGDDKTTTVVIANGGSLSGLPTTTIPSNYRVAAIVMPAAWSTAVLTVAVAESATGTFQPLYEGGSEYTVTEAAASRRSPKCVVMLCANWNRACASTTSGTPQRCSWSFTTAAR